MAASAQEITPLTQVELANSKSLPGLYLDKSEIYIAFGDEDVGQGDVPTRWANGDEYLHRVVQGFNTSEGQTFAIEHLNENRQIHLFPYRAEDPRYKAPCQVVENLAHDHAVVVVYSYGPK